MQKHACVRFLYFDIIEKSINRWRLPGCRGGGGACKGFSQKNMFKPGDLISLSLMTWLPNKITASTPTGSHSTRCVCEPHAVDSVCWVSIWCLNIFSQGGGVWSPEKDQDPLLPHAIPVSYGKCVVNQKRLLVGAEQIVRGVHSEKSSLLVTSRALWICLGRANELPKELNDYYERVCAFPSGVTQACCLCNLWLFTSSAAKKIQPQTEERGKRDRDRGQKEAVNERNR